MTPENLLREYLVDHDLRPASAKIYGAAMKKLEKNSVSYTHLTLPTNREV